MYLLLWMYVFLVMYIFFLCSSCFRKMNLVKKKISWELRLFYGLWIKNMKNKYKIWFKNIENVNKFEVFLILFVVVEVKLRYLVGVF